MTPKEWAEWIKALHLESLAESYLQARWSALYDPWTRQGHRGQNW